jgi:outer membrane receptor protein involved in Fe transport
MKRMLNRNMLTLLSALSLSTASSWAQSPAPAGNSVSTSTHDDDVYLMDPFTVTTDTPGYKALDTLGGSRVRTELADTPSSLTVVTSKLMQDLNVTNAQDLLVYTTNTEVAGTSGNYSGVSSRGFGVSSEGTRLVNPGNVNRSRGLTAMDNTRNYFQTEIPWDGYNISRVDISRGPNSFLFGVGSPSGISNYSTNQAFYSNQGSVEGHYGSYGSTRESLDYNKVILDNQLAVRVDLMNDRRLFKQKPAYNNSKREYADVRFDPKFFNTPSSHMKIEFNFENGKVDSSNPRELPPMDYISGYFDSTTNKNGYNPYTFNPNSANVDPSGSLWVTNEDMGYAWGSQATYWYDASTGKTLRTSQASSGGTRSDGTYIGGFNGYNMVNGSNSTVNVYHLYTTGFNHYAIASNYADSSKYPGAYDRTVTYIDKTLSDTSIFDFYNNLIDGPNKHEWQNWNTYNLNIVESLFNDRLSIQAVVTHEDYKNGQEGQLLSLTNPYISVDMDSYMFLYPTWQSGATTNSNEGRAFIGGTYGSGNETYYSHDNCQLTAAYSLRFSDFMEESLLTHILGHQEFTGLTGQYITNQEERGFQLYRTDLAFAEATRLGEKVGDSNINWVAYLGSPMTGATSASGLHLSNLNTRLIPNSGPITMWDGTWTAGSGVNAADPWVNSTPTGDVTMTQADNPANYKGYRSYAATIQNWRDSDDLYTSGDKKRQTLTSSAFLYQGYFWDDAIIPSFGVRRDRVRQQGTEATKDATTNIVSMNYDLADEGVVMYTTSMSYGLALHTAPFFKGLYPKGMDVTFYYFHGDNQTPKVRYGIDGEQLPNEKGKTDDLSVQLDALDNRVSLRLTYFKTIDNNVSLSGQPLGSQAWLIDSLPCWTLGFAACGAAAASMPASAMPSDLQSNSWLWSWATEHPDKALEIANAMKTDFANLFPQSYWDQYGIPVNVQAIKNGDWLHVLSNGASPIPWNIANTHLIHGTSPIVDQDVESKGFELEATVRPFNNWDITFNASKVQARQTALGEDAANYLNGLAKLYLDTVVGDTPMWGNYNGPVKNQFMSGLWSPYLLQTALTGADQPEIRKWNFKLISNYTFNEGLIKGVNVGGAVRWASKQIVGYGIKEATVYGKDAWIADVDQPYYGSDDTHLDLWVGYQRKLTDQIDWRVQLNLRNVGETAHLVTVAVEPDGTVAQQRIADGMSYDLSMKFMF